MIMTDLSANDSLVSSCNERGDVGADDKVVESVGPMLLANGEILSNSVQRSCT